MPVACRIYRRGSQSTPGRASSPKNARLVDRMRESNASAARRRSLRSSSTGFGDCSTHMYTLAVLYLSSAVIWNWVLSSWLLKRESPRRSDVVAVGLRRANRPGFRRRDALETDRQVGQVLLRQDVVLDQLDRAARRTRSASAAARARSAAACSWAAGRSGWRGRAASGSARPCAPGRPSRPSPGCGPGTFGRPPPRRRMRRCRRTGTGRRSTCRPGKR